MSNVNNPHKEAVAVGEAGDSARKVERVSTILAAGAELTDRQKAWVRGYQGQYRKENLPPGVCNTVYYIKSDGTLAHFTPGLAPPKMRKQILSTIIEPAKEEGDADDYDDDNEIEIPAALE